MVPSRHFPQDDGFLTSNFRFLFRLSVRLSAPTIPQCLDSLSSTPSIPIFLKYDGYASFAATIQDNLHTDHGVLGFSGTFEVRQLSYNFLTGLLTIKMPRFAHETIAGLFKTIVDKQLFAMCEPDACWAPESTDYLAVVLEFGALESAPRLVIDARGWLETRGMAVKACIMINLSQANHLIFDVWQHGRRTYAVSSRNLPSPAVRTDPISLAVFADEIRLEFAMFVARPAATNLEQGIVMGRSLLVAFANRFWRHQNWCLHIKVSARQ
ncbi:hypothetical protein BDV10DRAFT_202343 [Aspergillus recurvatus]